MSNHPLQIETEDIDKLYQEGKLVMCEKNGQRPCTWLEKVLIKALMTIEKWLGTR